MKLSNTERCDRLRLVRIASHLSVAFLATNLWATTGCAQQTLRLYDGVAPGSEQWQFPETVQTTPNGRMIANVRDPELSVDLPAQSNGAAVILLTGGAMRFLAFGRETDDIIARFNEHGIAVITLKYRTLQVDPAAQSGVRESMGATQAMLKNLANMEIRNANANPDPGNETLKTVLGLAVADGQAALRMVRAHAEEWRIDPHRVGMLGISAGGGVAIGTIVAHADGGAPDFFISLYGPSLQDVVVPKPAPPIFLATEANHGPVTKGLVALYSVWRAAGQSAELHVYEVPNFSMTSALWGERVFAWLAERKLLEPAATR